MLIVFLNSWTHYSLKATTKFHWQENHKRLNLLNLKTIALKDIANIKDCRKENNCKTFLDSDYTSFKIKDNDTYRTFGFEELHPAKNEKYLETEPKNRIEAQEILTYLDKELNLEEKFYNTIKRLPEGSYSYFSGYSIISMNSSKKK